MDKKVIGRECVHARYASSKTDNNDILLIKEKIHYDDGSIVPNLRVIENYQREFYVTKSGFRNHQQKKEWEDIAKCNRYITTQKNLANAVAKALGKPQGMHLRSLNNSPYVYCTDITTEKLIKYEYQKRWPDFVSPWTLAVMDYETDVVYGTETIISGSLTFKNRAILCYRTDFLNGSKDTVELIQTAFDKHLKKYKEQRNINLEIKPVNSAIEIVHTLCMKAHEFKADIIGFWNMSFDVDKMLETIKAAKMSPEDFFCHPSLDSKYKSFKWKKKDPKKETLSGAKKSIFNEELWHKAIHPAGFYLVDLMSLYCNIRMASGKRESYKLDSVLSDELDITKLKFTQADHLTGIDWHQFMQSKYKIEYLVYNLFDCISVELLDEKNKDVAQVLPALLGVSDVNTFDSNPRKLADGLHFFCIENNKVMGSTSEDMREDDDKLQIDKSGWIATLASHLLDKKMGSNLIEEDPNLLSNFFTMVADLDIEGSYPTSEIILNVSKETTKRELCKIQGISEFSQRITGLNMTNAQGNAVEIAHNILNMPTFDEMLKNF